MSTDNGEVNTDDLETFSNEFYGKEPEKVEETPAEEVKDADTGDLPATLEDKPTEEDTPDDDTEKVETDEESKFNLGRKKLTARERIEQLNGQRREEERLRIAAEDRLRDLEARLAKQAEEVEVKTKTTQEVSGPSPDDLGDDGEAKYPLGEYDPDYIKALHEHAKDEARLEVAKEFQRQRDEQVKASIVQDLQTSWDAKVAETEATLPDLKEKGFALEQALSDADPRILEDLAMTLMTLRNGPEVLYYLSENVGEAREIAKGGPSALLALGRLDGMVRPAEKKTEVKVTQMQEPPPSRTRGTSGKFSVPGDTDDLEAFSRDFFAKRGP